jgi:branched-chain amino acid transport system ATP-binding protein
MLEVDAIDVAYGPVQALRGVSLRVNAGEMVALLGSNGAGKTTTLRTISGMLAPARGSIKIDGADAGGLSAHRVVRLGVAHLPEGRELFPELTVYENLKLGHWSRRKESGFGDRIDRVFDLFPRLKERATQAAGTMSGGEQQMLAAGRALMSEPKLLLVDELSLGLAPMVVDLLFQALRAVNATGTSILLVEQFAHLALRNTSRAYVLAKGEIAMEAPSAKLENSPDLIAAYLGGEVPDAKESGFQAGTATPVKPKRRAAAKKAARPTKAAPRRRKD